MKKFRKMVVDENVVDPSAIGDIAFLLLIFFIVTSSFLINMGIPVSLPAKDGSAVKVEEKNLIEITPHTDGFMYDKRVLSQEELENELTKRKNHADQPVVLIYMQSNIRYARLIDTLSIARKLSLYRISIKYIEGKI